MEATIRDLRLHTTEVLAAADRGERVTITRRGQVRAVLMRCEDPGGGARPSRNPACGSWRDRHETVDEQVRGMRQPRALPSCASTPMC